MIDDALPTRQDKGEKESVNVRRDAHSSCIKYLLGTLIATTQRVIANGYNGVLGDRYSDATKMIAYTLATTGVK